MPCARSLAEKSTVRSTVEKPWSLTRKTSVFSRTPCFCSSASIMPRCVSLSRIASSAAGWPGDVRCCVKSGSPSQSTLYFGTPFFHRCSSRARVVHKFCAVLDAISFGYPGHLPSVVVRFSPNALGYACPSKTMGAPPDGVRSNERSWSRPMPFVPATAAV